jgi:pSer/pThr/pTyr-binding forkhead associated (FHA) protein
MATIDMGALLANGEEHLLRQNLRIGRGEGNDIQIDDVGVSRRHAALVWAEERWCIEDRGSANGTWVNDERVPFGTPRPLRHGDRIRIGTEVLVFSWPADRDDPDRTDELTEVPQAPDARLSPLQLQVVRCLCGAWLGGATLDALPTNEQIAAQLGTPGATDTVKAALRRIYAKAGISDLPAHQKRRALCRIARQRGWL